MSSFLAVSRNRPAIPVARQCLRRSLVASQLHSSAPRLTLKESDKNRDNLAEEMEYQKQEQLRRQKEGNPHWHESLASASESIVKAERNETPDTEQSSAMEESIKKVKQDRVTREAQTTWEEKKK
ncbi:hypothetical protein VTO42DRAFT_6153 [Malbranchea cinnamomea]